MKKIILYFGLILLVFSCIKKEIELTNLQTESFDPSFAIPIGSLKLELGTVQDELTNSFLQINPTTGGMEFVVLDQTLIDYAVSDIFTIPNQSFNTQVGIPSSAVVGFNLAPMGTTADFKDSITSSFAFSNGELMDSLILEIGRLNLAVSSTFPHNAVITLTIPALKNNGVSFTKTYNLNYGSTIPVTASSVESLDGFTMDLTNGGVSNNTLEFKYSVTMTKSSAVAITGSEAISLTMGIEIDELELARGYFGNTAVNVSDSIEIGVFDASFSGDLSFASPRLEMSTYNMTGIPLGVNFNSFTMPNNTINKVLTGPGLTGHPVVPAAVNIGDTTETFHQIDNSNTSPQLYLFLQEKPNLIKYSAGLQLNPGGVTQNFIGKDSRVWANARFVLPLDARVKGFVLEDTTNTSLEEIIGIGASDANSIKKILIRIIADNALPIETKLQAYFTDSNNVLIDSLFDAGSQDLLRGATVNFSLPANHPDYGKVTSASRSIVDISVTGKKYTKLIEHKASKIVYKATTNTAGAMNHVKFTPDNYVKLKISAKVDINVVIN